jgi:hypothetical protein
LQGRDREKMLATEMDCSFDENKSDKTKDDMEGAGE